MNYKEKVDTFVSIVKEAIEFEQSGQIILENNIAYDVAKELYYMDKSKFKHYTEDMFDRLLAEHDILSVCILNSSDGTVKLFLQEVFNAEGNTLIDNDSDFILIEDNLLDCVDTSIFECVVGVIKETEKVDTECIENDEEDELDELFEELTAEIIQDILDNQDNPNFCSHCSIKDVITEAYEIGFRDCIVENGIVE